MVTDGCELQRTIDGRGEGVYARRSFQAGETVIAGVIERRVARNHSHATQVGSSEYVELSGLAPKVNHSCDPNCGVRVNHYGAPDLVARRLIGVGEEITFDYAMRNYTVEHFTVPCGCRSRYCRTWVTGWKDLPPQLRTEYQGLVAPYLLELDNETTSAEAFRPRRARWHLHSTPTSSSWLNLVGRRLKELSRSRVHHTQR